MKQRNISLKMSIEIAMTGCHFAFFNIAVCGRIPNAMFNRLQLCTGLLWASHFIALSALQCP